jgi:hypothetical protein
VLGRDGARADAQVRPDAAKDVHHQDAMDGGLSVGAGGDARSQDLDRARAPASTLDRPGRLPHPPIRKGRAMATSVDETLEPGRNWAMRGRRDRDRIQGILDGIVLDGRLTWTEVADLAEALAQTDPSHRRHWPLSAIDAAFRRWLAVVPPGARSRRGRRWRNSEASPTPRSRTTIPSTTTSTPTAPATSCKR